MALVEQELVVEGTSAFTGPTRQLFTRDDYQAMAAHGLLNASRIELIQGEVFDEAPSLLRF